MSFIGCIVDSTVTDTNSANPTADYLAQVHGGTDITCATIYSNQANIKHLDRTTKATDVTGKPILPPPSFPVPQPLVRIPPVVGIVNTEARGVYFEGKLVPVIGDGINAPLAAPNPRLLTTPTNYPTIHIGTRT